MTPAELLAYAPALSRHSLLGLPRPRRRKRKALRPLREPRGEMLRYTAVLRRVVAETVALVRERLIPRLPALLAEAGRFTPERTDDASDTLAQIIEALRGALGLSEPEARRRAVEMLERVQRGHAQGFMAAYEDSLAVNPLAGAEPWLRDQMALAVKENARLITSLPEQMLQQIEGVVSQGVLSGLRHEEMAKAIVRQFGIADNRAALIARDQVLSWHGSLTRLRQVDAGVTHYEFSTSRDERVRPGHRALDGTVQSWAKPPIVDPRTGRRAHPGGDVNCRCAAIPKLDNEEV
jgi:SPP1 gp7 family putative phage head morphogenesis protein